MPVTECKAKQSKELVTHLYVLFLFFLDECDIAPLLGTCYHF